MKWYCKIGIIAVIAILFYLIGNWIPLDYLKPKIEETPLKSSEYYSLVIRVIAAIITFLAVVVALFKEDFRKLWDYSKLEIKLADESGIIEKLEIERKETNSESKLKHYKAEKYESVLVVENIGNKTAKNCEIYLEKICFKGNEYIEEQNILIHNSSLVWNNDNERKIHIPPKGKKKVTIVELFEPKKQALPNGEEEYSASQLFIGKVLNPTEYTSGKWEVHFIVYSDDSNPKKILFSLGWNGKWEQRFSEIKNCLTIKLEEK